MNARTEAAERMAIDSGILVDSPRRTEVDTDLASCDGASFSQVGTGTRLRLKSAQNATYYGRHAVRSIFQSP